MAKRKQSPQVKNQESVVPATPPTTTSVPTPVESPSENAGFRKSVNASLVAGIIMLIVLDPLVRFCWRVLLLFGSGAFEGVVNQVYRDAALGVRNWVLVCLVSLGYTTAVGVYFGVTAALLAVRFTPRLAFALANAAKPPALARKPRNGTFWLFHFLSCALLLTSFLWVADVFMDLQLNTSFEQRLTVLAASVDEHEIKTLRARWAMMHDRADYLKIVSDMETLADSKGIKLPPLLVR